ARDGTPPPWCGTGSTTAATAPTTTCASSTRSRHERRRMKVSLNWLLEFVDLPTRDVGELSRVLAFLGHEVEGVETIEVGWTDVVVAHVDDVQPHPNADKVRLCAVSTGGDPIDVVCGAWNFEAGAKVAFAKPGAVLPGDFQIGVRTIRGVESHGMICSEKELGLGDDAEGILVLEPG